ALDWRLLDELMAAGAMPNLQAIVTRGAHAVLDVPPPLISPVVWTTIATGTPPEVHGVLDFLETDTVDGSARPVGSGSRKVPALWEMTAAAGRETAVIGWWATFPATAQAGITIYSDRLTEQLIGLEVDSPGVAAPQEASVVARRLQVRPADVTAAMLAPFARVDDRELAEASRGGSSWESPVGGLTRLVAATLTVERLTAHELERDTDAIFIYLEGTDVVGHLFGAHRPPAMTGITSEEALRWGGVPDRYYTKVDQWIGQVAERAGNDATLVIVSDHGFTWGRDRPPVESGTQTATAEWWHRPEGVFIAAGPRVSRTANRQRLEILDVAPALLALAGLPRGSEMPGVAPNWLLSPGDTDRGTVSYTRLLPRESVAQPAIGEDAKREQMAKLRALGYLGGPPPGSAGVSAGESGDRAEARRLNNLGSSQFGAGKIDEAEQTFRLAIAADPRYASAHHNLSIVYRTRGHLADADREFWTAVDYGIADREMAIVRLALDYRERGDAERAAAVFAEGRRRFPSSEEIWLNSGVFHGAKGELAKARTYLERAAEINPSNPAAHRNLAAALAGLGDSAGARRALTRASRLVPEDETLRQDLAALGGPLN
ncbi:MAG: alkaline phosphatase family protein, partial [Thermoanaerobaculia bacterium]